MQIDFMIIGAQKCGTSTLFDILDSHPSVVGSRPKEPHFFCSTKDWRAELPEYERLFTQKQGVLYFEASTTYTFYPLRNLRIWDDLFEYNPNMKLIYLVRHPVHRIVSGYMHLYARGYTDFDIQQALTKQRSLIYVTRYYTQIYPYIRKFGRENILIIDFDDLVNSRKLLLIDISEFLGIKFDNFTDYENIHANVSVRGGKIHHKFDSPTIPFKLIRRFLPSIWNKLTNNSAREFQTKPLLTLELTEVVLNLLQLEIGELQRLMNKDLSKWLSPEIANAG